MWEDNHVVCLIKYGTVCIHNNVSHHTQPEERCCPKLHTGGLTQSIMSIHTCICKTKKIESANDIELVLVNLLLS